MRLTTRTHLLWGGLRHGKLQWKQYVASGTGGGLAIILVEFGKSFLLIRHAKVDLLIEALGVEDLQCDLDLIFEQITGLFFDFFVTFLRTTFSSFLYKKQDYFRH